MSHRLRPAGFVVLAAILASGAAYLVFELAVQGLARLGAIGEYADYRYFQEHLVASLARDGHHPQAPVDSELGWIQASTAFGPATGSDGGPPTTILFLGDSVTWGDAAVRGESDYVSRVAAALAPRGIRVVNAASSGYGVDQMMLRLPRETEAWSPAFVVVAYIPHDLLRVGRSRFIRLTKPRVEVSGAALVVHPPRDLEGFYAEQGRALRGLHYGPWLLAERFAQRRAEVPGLYLDWYAAVLDRIAARTAAGARRADSALWFVEIPNHADAEAEALLAPIMRDVLRAGEAAGQYRFTRLEPCLRERAAPAAWPTPEFTAPHPGPEGHAELSACMLAEVVRPFLAGAGESGARPATP